MKKLILFLGLMPFLVSCSKDTFQSKGFFSSLRIVPDSSFFIPTFITPKEPPAKKMTRITEGGLSYYEWKTIKYNRDIDSASTERFLTFATITNQEIDTFSVDEKQYLKVKGNVLSNYLFFIDDYRCIYISQDDTRSLSYGDIPLYFDDKDYELSKNNKKVSIQLLRGYYSIKESSIFIDFERARHFYIKGTITASDQILFKEIFIPNEKNGEGINRGYTALSESINELALPVFEKPNRNGPLIHDRFSLYFGFIGKKPTNPLHLKMLNNHANDFVFDLITDISYGLDENNEKVRIYKYRVSKDGIDWSPEYQVVEKLSVDEITGKNEIETW